MPRPAFGTERVGEPLPPAPLRAFHAAPLQVFAGRQGSPNPYTPPPPCKWAGTNDTNDQTTVSPRETDGRLGCRLPFGGPQETTIPPLPVVSAPAPVVLESPQRPQTTTAVDVVSVVSVVSSRPKEESPTRPGPTHGPPLADRAVGNALAGGVLGPGPAYAGLQSARMGPSKGEG